MTNPMIPYSFTPGTKANAREVNANFNALAEKIDENNATAVHSDSDTTITGKMTFSKAITTTGKHHDTQGNLTILNIADDEYCDAILAKTDDDKNCASVRITNADGYNIIEFGSYNEDGSEKLTMGLRNTNGISYAFAPTYTSNYADSSNRIVTTAYMANHWATTAASTTATASKVRPAVVVKNYRNGYSWYRVWSDGWIEQGGYTQGGNPSSTITFLKSFTNTNFTIALGTSGVLSTNNNGICSVEARTTSTIKLYSFSSYYCNWYACGY